MGSNYLVVGECKKCGKCCDHDLMWFGYSTPLDKSKIEEFVTAPTTKVVGFPAYKIVKQRT